MPLVPHAFMPKIVPASRRRAFVSLLLVQLSLSFTQATHAIPARVNGLLAAGDTAARREDYAAALADFNRAVALAPDDADALAGRAVVEINQGKRDRAMADSQKALTRDPKNARAHYGRAGAYLLKGDYVRAEADLMQALSDFPKAPEYRWKVARVFYALGVVNSRRGEAAKAEAHYTQAIVLDPHFAASRIFRSSLRLQERDIDGAINDASAALALHPMKVEAAYALYDRGIAYAYQRDYHQAVVDLTSAINTDPKKAIYYSSRGAAREGLGDYTHAIPDLTVAIRLAPKVPSAFYNRGVAYSRLNQPGRALADYTKVIALNGRMERAYASRGNAYESLGDYDHAIADETTAISLNPNNVGAYRYRAFAYAKKGDHKRAAADQAKVEDFNRPPT